MRPPLSLRARLALWHAAVLGALALVLVLAGTWYARRALLAQVDEEMTETARLVTTSLAQRGMGREADRTALREVRVGRLDVLLLDPAARRVVAARSGRPRTGDTTAGDSETWRPFTAALAASRFAALPAPDTTPLTVRDSTGAEMRVLALPVNGGPLVLVAGRDLADVEAITKRMRVAAAVAVLAALPVAFGLGWLLASRSLAPLGTMREQAARLGASNLVGRLRTRDADDELGRLAAVFNALLDRLAATLEQQRQFMADASHELRTPAAVVRAATDVALRRDDRTAAEYRSALEITHAEAERMSRLVDDLFLLAHADATQPALQLRDYYLQETLGDCERALRPVAQARGVRLARVPEDGNDDALGGAPCHGDEALVRRLVLNLLENAVRFTPRGGTVTLRLAEATLPGAPRARAAWRVEVEDTGPGVPSALHTRIFDRFFHSEAHAPPGAGTRGGAGLGLAMARVIAEAHGGSLSLARSTERGSVFAVLLPHDPRPDADGAGAVTGETNGG